MHRIYVIEVVNFTDEPEEFVQQLFYNYVEQLPKVTKGMQQLGEDIGFIKEV